MCNDNISIVRKFYELRLLSAINLGIVDKDIIWNVTPGAPYGGIYRGWENVNIYLTEMRRLFYSLDTIVESYYSTYCSHVFTTGYYDIIKSVNTPSIKVYFVHNWNIQEGRIVGLTQIVDSATLWRAANNK